MKFKYGKYEVEVFKWGKSFAYEINTEIIGFMQIGVGCFTTSEDRAILKACQWIDKNG